MRTIYKYPVEINDTFEIALPRDAKVLTVQTQGARPCMWAIVDTNQPSETRQFRLVGTGHPLDDGDDGAAFNYIGSFQMKGGLLVFHLFEIIQ